MPILAEIYGPAPFKSFAGGNGRNEGILPVLTFCGAIDRENRAEDYVVFTRGHSVGETWIKDNSTSSSPSHERSFPQNQFEIRTKMSATVTSDSAPTDWASPTPFGPLQESYSERRLFPRKEVRHGHYDIRLGCRAPVEHRSRPHAFRPTGSRATSAGSVDDQAITARKLTFAEGNLASLGDGNAVCFLAPARVANCCVPLVLCLVRGQSVIEEKKTGETSDVSCERWKKPYHMNTN